MRASALCVYTNVYLYVYTYVCTHISIHALTTHIYLSICLSVYLSMRWHSMLCVSTLTPQSCASRAVMRGFKVFVTLSPKNANTQM